MEYKIIDFNKRGNTVRFYLAQDKKLIEESWGDDWDDTPYEHNAGRVYSEFIEKIVDVYFGFDMKITEPCEDWYYGGNSPYCKDDFKIGRTPCLVVYMPSEDEHDWMSDLEYHNLVNNNKALKIYYGDTLDNILEVAKYYEEVDEDASYM